MGKFLRKVKVDELPQLWNVICGDMALVGPRPEVPRYVDLLDPLWQKVLSVRPGVTDPSTLRLLDEEEVLSRVKGDRDVFYREQLLPLKLASVSYLERGPGGATQPCLNGGIPLRCPGRRPPVRGSVGRARSEQEAIRHTCADDWSAYFRRRPARRAGFVSVPASLRLPCVAGELDRGLRRFPRSC